MVAGASSAIGQAVAVVLAQRGMQVHCWGRDEARLEETARLCRAAGASATVHSIDVTDATAVPEGLAAAAADGRLATVVWCVGLFDWAPAEAADPDTWVELLGTNLTAAAALTAMAAPLLVSARATGASPPALVYVGSAAGHLAYAGNAAYVASKHGLTGLARATFLDLRRHGVKVSLVSPGLVAAGAGLGSPVGQQSPELLLAPEDVAGAVAFVVDHSARGCPTEIHLQPFVEG